MNKQRTELDAGIVSALRTAFPTVLDTAGLRALGADVLSRAVFSAQTSNAIYVSKIKEVVDAMAAGKMDFATARWTLKETLKAVGYTPEGGFPEEEESKVGRSKVEGRREDGREERQEVPPALRGTLKDLSSNRRVELILNTQLAMMRGRGQQLRGHERAGQFPAWELVRVYQKTAPRNWDGSEPSKADPRSRWMIAGGKFWGGTSNIERPTSNIEGGGRMIALKGDPIWGELGGYDNFPDALGVDHPPFAFNSGMGWREISAGECRRLGITGPGGETPKEWQASRPVVLDGQLPAPRIDVTKVDPALVEALGAEHGITVERGKAMRTEDRAKVLADLDAEEAAILERRAARRAKAIADRQEEYSNR